MYPADLVAPMRKELTDIGFTELLVLLGLLGPLGLTKLLGLLVLSR